LLTTRWCKSKKKRVRLFLRHIPDEADQEREDYATDRATANIANPSFNGLADESSYQRAQDATANGASNRIAQCPEGILLGNASSRAAANSARHDLHKQIW
jgi:hypothetical protein